MLIRMSHLLSWTSLHVLLLGLLSPCAFAEQQWSVSKAPGRLVSVHGQQLHIHCIGRGSPTVVFQPGLGGSSAEWLELQQQLGRVTHTCVYDRAGLGWSGPAHTPRVTANIVKELHALLSRANVPAPYLLVGHSFGGINAQVFANEYPGETAGLLLLDSSHPQQVDRFLQPPIKLNTAPSRRGTVRFAPLTLPQSLPDDLRELATALTLLPKARHAMVEEYFGFRLSLRQASVAHPLPDVPVIVISHGQRIWPDTPKGDLIERLWVELQGDLIDRLPRAAHMVARHAGHHVHLDQPNLVWDATVELVSMYRETRDAGAPGPQGRTWLAFEGATWLSDRLKGTNVMIAVRSEPLDIAEPEL